jgi:hypothetical protein
VRVRAILKDEDVGIVDQGVPERLVAMTCRQFGIDTFVETGTYQGETTAYAARSFKRVFTVELDAALHAQARSRFASQPQVECVQGNSPDGLRQILPRLGGDPVMFWLDAHSSAVCDCPLLEEVGLINAWDESGEKAFLLVDDARYFLAPPPLPHKAEDWPGLDAVIPLLSAGGRRCIAVVEDVIIAYPGRAREHLTAYARSRPGAWEEAKKKGGIYFVPRAAMSTYSVQNEK